MKIFKVVGFPPEYLIGEFINSAQEYFNDFKKTPKRVNFREYFSHIKDQNGNLNIFYFDELTKILSYFKRLIY